VLGQTAVSLDPRPYLIHAAAQSGTSGRVISRMAPWDGWVCGSGGGG